ncbi:MAG: MATE family efflux transporter [Paracoccaceae bacterium]
MSVAAPPRVSRPEVTYARVAAIALPVVLSNAAVPIQGAIDTAIIGNLGREEPLAAVTLGATVITLVFSSFNFLQMGSSGLTAQAFGSSDGERVRDTLLRALAVAGASALVLLLLSRPIVAAGLGLFEASDEVEALAAAYILIRLWGAPAELAIFALIGSFTGQEQTRRLVEMQLTTSVANVGFNLLFVFGLGWGVEGVAIGTVLGAHAGLAVGLWRMRGQMRRIAPADARLDWRRILERRALLQVMALNRDIFIRTICITGSFAWLARLGSLQGDTVLAANGVLLQFIYVAAYALDGFAMAAETLVGQALGARDRRSLDRAVVLSSVSALAAAGIFALAASLSAPALVALFTNVESVREVATEHVLWASCLPLVGVLAYQADGIFIGAAEGRAMRNAMLVSTGIFLPLSWALTHAMGNHGLWLALWIYMLLRLVTLAIRYPALADRTVKR